MKFMNKYSYKIANKNGSVKTGQIEADSSLEVSELIKSDNWYILSIKPKLSLFNQFSFLTKKEKLSPIERIAFTDHLTSMISSGTPIIDALEAYREEDTSRMTSIIDKLIREIQQGKKLSEAMAFFPTIFSSFYLSLIQAGELTGALDETLAYLGNELRKEHEFRERIKSALIYPALVIVVAFMVIMLLVFLVIPKITQLAQSLGGDVPLATKIVVFLASSFSLVAPFILLFLVAGIIAFTILSKKPKFKKRADLYLLRVPLVGPALKKYTLARFLRVIGSCLRCGILLTSALETVSQVVANSQYKEACKRINERIKKGSSLSEALSHEGTNLFPKIIIRTLKGAEKTGNLDAATIRLSSFYEIEVDRNLKRATDLIEPVLMVVLGIIVGGIAIAVVGPIYQITSKIK